MTYLSGNWAKLLRWGQKGDLLCSAQAPGVGKEQWPTQHFPNNGSTCPKAGAAAAQTGSGPVHPPPASCQLLEGAPA